MRKGMAPAASSLVSDGTVNAALVTSSDAAGNSRRGMSLNALSIVCELIAASDISSDIAQNPSLGASERKPTKELEDAKVLAL